MRIGLLLGLAAGLVLLVVQNWSVPGLALTFLGFKTQALPLGIWLLIALGSGMLTSWVMGAFQGLLVRSRPVVRRPVSAPPPRREPVQEVRERVDYTTRRPQPAPPPPPPRPEPQAMEEEEPWSDWEEEPRRPQEDEWDVESPPMDAPRPHSPQPQSAPPPQDYERSQTPQTSQRSGSFYSYSYQDPKNSAVGKTETVYDADYRVITPPYRDIPPEKPKPPQEDEWGLRPGEEDWEED